MMRILFIDRDGVLIEEPENEHFDSFPKFRLMSGVVGRDSGGRPCGHPRARPAGTAIRIERGARVLSRRIIPRLDVRDGEVVKGVRFRDHVVMRDVA